MNWAGPIIGPLFAFEGFAFFTEAFFLGSTCMAGRIYDPGCTWRPEGGSSS